MPQSHSNPGPKPIFERPTCLKCGVEMWLGRIEPSDEADRDHRTFECPLCQHTQAVILKFK
jgi:DNA-directed RNA polymerase subunit RPC12/RpoP